jgi:hypothetical protein
MNFASSWLNCRKSAVLPTVQPECSRRFFFSMFIVFSISGRADEGSQPLSTNLLFITGAGLRGVCEGNRYEHTAGDRIAAGYAGTWNQNQFSVRCATSKRGTPDFRAALRNSLSYVAIGVPSRNAKSKYAAS